jgi:hypothetical protein
VSSDTTIENEHLTFEELKSGIEMMYATYREQEGMPDMPVIRLGFLTATMHVIKEQILANDKNPTLDDDIVMWLGDEGGKCMALINDEFDMKLMFG